jgi:hypothetical protein
VWFILIYTLFTEECCQADPLKYNVKILSPWLKPINHSPGHGSNSLARFEDFSDLSTVWFSIYSCTSAPMNSWQVYKWALLLLTCRWFLHLETLPSHSLIPAHLYFSVWMSLQINLYGPYLPISNICCFISYHYRTCNPFLFTLFSLLSSDSIFFISST